MNADMVAEAKPANLPYLNALEHMLIEGALPGEIVEFSEADRREAARFVAGCAERRPPGIALVRLESVGGQVGQRRMRICIVNDDMPFLVDSVAMAITARGLIIHRLLHPVVCVEREDNDCLRMVEPLCDYPSRRESMIASVSGSNAASAARCAGAGAER